jgi:DNA-directed RNA polymerase specialized sigma24 family protein
MENAADHDAWLTFQQRYQTPLRSLARGAGLSESEADEVLNRTMEAIWKSLGTFDQARGTKSTTLTERASRCSAGTRRRV